LVTNPGAYTKTDLQNDFTPVPETVNGDNYTGVPLWTFLNTNDPNFTDDLVVTAGTDGYEVVLSLAELDPRSAGIPAICFPMPTRPAILLVPAWHAPSFPPTTSTVAGNRTSILWM
jgi:hypothetical protein